PGFPQGVFLLKAMGRSRLRKVEGLADQRAQLLVRQPAVDVFGAAALLLWRGVENGEPKERQVLGVERSDRKNRLSLPSGHDHDSATPGHQIDRAHQIRLA